MAARRHRKHPIDAIDAARLVAALAFAGSAFAQGSATPPEAYAPGLGEVMSLQLMRHAKLWFAGQQRNWPLASYELDELKEGFDDASRFHPRDAGVPIAEMIPQLTSGPLAALRSAIDQRQPQRFAASYDQLTAACNACHAGAGHGFIRITRPRAPDFTNQQFAPAR